MLEWLGELSEEDREKRIKQAFKNTAAKEDGQIVFHVIFENLYFFRKTETPDQQALNNYAKFLLEYFGENAIYRVMEALIKKE